MALTSSEIHVSLDIGSKQHNVAIGLSSGELLDEFEMVHQSSGFSEFFQRIKAQEDKFKLPVAIAMEGYNGWARPLDKLVLEKGYKLLNINNLKLARFKEIFPSPAKTDYIDARKGLELFQLSSHLPLIKGALQEVPHQPKTNEILKRLTRRRRRFVNEKIRYMSTLQVDLQAVCPGLLTMTKDAENMWFLRLLGSVKHLTKLANLKETSLLKIKGVGKKFAQKIQDWQPTAFFSHDIEWVNDMILEDVQHILNLKEKIKALDTDILNHSNNSEIASYLNSIPGFGATSCAELAGEIGTIDRFNKESSLAIYLGMAPLDNSSGKFNGAKQPKHVNTRGKSAMMCAVDHHRKGSVRSDTYYQKKRAEGKKHNQAVRALGRQMIKVIFKMLTEKRNYKLES